MLARGAPRGGIDALALLADPKAGTEQLAEEAARLAKERKAHEKIIRKAGGVGAIERKLAEAENVLEQVGKDAEAIVSQAHSDMAAEKLAFEKGKTAHETKQREDLAKMTERETSALRKVQAAARAEKDAKTAKREAQSNAKASETGRKNADAKMAEAEALLTKLSDIQQDMAARLAP